MRQHLPSGVTAINCRGQVHAVQLALSTEIVKLEDVVQGLSSPLSLALWRHLHQISVLSSQKHNILPRLGTKHPQFNRICKL